MRDYYHINTVRLMTANSNFQTNKSLGQGHNINFIFKMTDCKLLFQVNICAKNAGGF